MKPVIGILADISKINYLNKEMPLYYSFVEYSHAIIKSGGIPIIIVPTKIVEYNKLKNSEIAPLTNEEKELLINQINLCDGIILPGGDRAFEHNYFVDTYTKENNIPTLGICLGMQVMCINKGDKLIRLENDNHLKTTHEIKLYNSLKSMIGESHIIVNSYHRSVVPNSNGYQICAQSNDDVIEAVEDPTKLFRLGVQWHPEKDLENKINKEIFNKFINAAKDFKNKR